MSGPTLTLVPPATLPPVQCRPWCKDGDGHIHADHVDDQACFSSVPDDDMTVTGDAQLSVNLAASSGGPVTVDLAVATYRSAVCTGVTVDEARRFALAVLATCDLAEQEQAVAR